jgi:hypothetical protein
MPTLSLPNDEACAVVCDGDGGWDISDSPHPQSQLLQLRLQSQLQIAAGSPNLTG